MKPSNGSHTLNITVGGVTTVTLVFDGGSVPGGSGFNAFGRRFEYDANEDWYVDPSGSMHLTFTAGPPNVVAGAWGSDNFGGTWT